MAGELHQRWHVAAFHQSSQFGDREPRVIELIANERDPSPQHQSSEFRLGVGCSRVDPLGKVIQLLGGLCPRHEDRAQAADLRIVQLRRIGVHQDLPRSMLREDDRNEQIVDLPRGISVALPLGEDVAERFRDFGFDL